MHSPNRHLVNPPVSSREAFAQLDAAKAAQSKSDAISAAASQDGVGRNDNVIHEPSAAERIAEHTGHDEYLLADAIADRLLELGVRLTSGERVAIAGVLTAHRG
jgi:hypothetical protein